jgi:hypothetical protein
MCFKWALKACLMCVREGSFGPKKIKNLKPKIQFFRANFKIINALQVTENRNVIFPNRKAL